MPIPTQAPEPEARRPAADRRALAPAGIAAAGAAYALAELLAGIVAAGFFAWGRAEALLFFALRPWLLLALALLIAPLRGGARVGVYAAALLLSALAETILVIRLGASNPLPEAARGVAGGALLAALLDLLVQLGIRFLPRWGRAAAAAAAIGLFLLSPGLRPYEMMVMGAPGASQAGARPRLMLMSALPLKWGEFGPLDPRSRSAAAYRMLEQEFAIRRLDLLDEGGLAQGALLLLAQPRGLAPAELVALDGWVRRGGRALILTDPMLVWPSDLPLGDLRRAPAVGLLQPLLDHWGLGLEPPEHPTVQVRAVAPAGVKRRLVTFAEGRLRSRSPECAVGESGLTADCRIGRGRAILLADADLLHDRLWTGTGAAGAERHVRIADNPLAVADYLDGLSGHLRKRIAGDVQWADPAADGQVATLLALLPLLIAATPGLARTIRRRR